MPNRSLVRCLPGSGLEDVINSFLEAYSKDPFGTHLVVPTSRLAKNVRRSVTKDGSPVVKTSVLTFRELVSLLFSENIPDLIMMSDVCSQLAISSVVMSNLGMLKSICSTKSVPAALTRELSDYCSTLIKYGIDSSSDKKRGSKDAELSLLYYKYLEFLKENSLADQNTAIVAILDWINRGGSSKIRNLFFYGLFEPPPLHRDLILAVMPSTDSFVYYVPYWKNPVFQDDASWLGIETVVDLDESELSTQKSLVFSDQKRDLSSLLELSYVRDRLSETRLIASRIRNLIHDGVSPRDIAVLFPGRDRSISLVSEVFPDFGIPYSAAYADRISQSIIVRTILDMISIPAFLFERERVVSFLHSPFVNYSWESDGKTQRMYSQEVDELSRKAGVFEGKDSWMSALNALKEDLETEANSTDFPDGKRPFVERDLEKISRISQGLSCLFGQLAEFEKGSTLKWYLDVTREQIHKWSFDRYFETISPHHRERESRAYDSFCRILDDLSSACNLLPEIRISLREFYSILASFVSNSRYDALEENINAVQILGLRESVHCSFDQVFIADAVEGELPRLGISLPFTNDEEAKRMGLLSRRDILRQEQYYFLAAIIAGKKKVYLSYSESDEGTPLVPSFFVESAMKNLCVKPRPINEFPGSIQLGQAKEGRDLVDGEFDSAKLSRVPPLRIDDLVRRISVEKNERVSGYFSEHDCVLSDAADISEETSRLFNDDRVYSASQIESYALCPFKFYCESLLRLKVIPDVERDLTPLDRGLLFHRIAFRFHSELRSKLEGSSLQSAKRSDALGILERIAKEEMRQHCVNSTVGRAYERRYFGGGRLERGMLHEFLDCEFDPSWFSFKPSYFEFAFGAKLDLEKQDPSSISSTLEIPLGKGSPKTIRLRGRVDRIDLVDPSEFVIIDYKTGRLDSVRKDEKGGREFQLPLYLMAVEGFLEGRRGIAGIKYKVAGVGDVKRKVDFGDKSEADLLNWRPRSYDPDITERLEDCKNGTISAILGMRSGAFHASLHYDECPSYCDFKTICRYDSLRLLDKSLEGSG